MLSEGTEPPELRRRSNRPLPSRPTDVVLSTVLLVASNPSSLPQRSPLPSGTVVYFNVLLRPMVEMSECAPTELPVAAAPQQEGFN